MAWTEEITESAKLLFSDGLSATQIADQLNEAYHTSFSRNAVIGKLHRCGLKRGERPIMVGKPKRTGPRGAYKKRWIPEPAIEPDTPPESTMTKDDEIPQAQRKTLMQLRAHDCRWPVGDPQASDFFFCGGQTVKGFPYCSYHVRCAYRPAGEVRKSWGMAA